MPYKNLRFSYQLFYSRSLSLSTSWRQHCLMLILVSALFLFEDRLYGWSLISSQWLTSYSHTIHYFFYRFSKQTRRPKISRIQKRLQAPGISRHTKDVHRQFRIRTVRVRHFAHLPQTPHGEAQESASWTEPQLRGQLSQYIHQVRHSWIFVKWQRLGM